MPIPILVAAVVAAVAAAGTGAGVAIYKNDKHNRASADWQEQKKRLQDKIAEYQTRLREREEYILQLQIKLTARTRELETVSKALRDTDNLIEILESRQRKLNSFIAILIALLTFRYSKNRTELNVLLGTIGDSRETYSRHQAHFNKAEEDRIQLETSIAEEAAKAKYYEVEIQSINAQLSNLVA